MVPDRLCQSNGSIGGSAGWKMGRVGKKFGIWPSKKSGYPELNPAIGTEKTAAIQLCKE